MEYGVFTSEIFEIAQTKFWTMCLYTNADKSIIGAKLYNGIDNNKTLAAVCERNITEGNTVYAFETPYGQKYTNDFDGVGKLLGTPSDYCIDNLKKIDAIELSEPYEMPSISDKGVAVCLKQWRMGTFYRLIHHGMQFQMITNKIEYIYQIQTDDCNIYCGASINIPYDNGMLGGIQYFRLRNYADNLKPFCRFYCDLGKDIIVSKADEIKCDTGRCSSTPHGLFWPLKRHDDNEIVLDGCSGDEYVFYRNRQKSEYFSISEAEY